jgi:hypothetical protein
MAELVQQIQNEKDQERFGRQVRELNGLLSEQDKRFEPPIIKTAALLNLGHRRT